MHNFKYSPQATLAQVAEVAQAAANSVRSMGISLSSCTPPGQPQVERLGPGEIEIGLGIHGEPGYEVAELAPSDALVERLLDHITLASMAGVHDNLPLKEGDRVALLVNNLGSTTPLELGKGGGRGEGGESMRRKKK